MSFLKLGVQTVVIDDEGNILLSKRGDLNVWNLPGGRVDVGEYLEAAAAREVFEETGLNVHIERAVGLYYLAGWNRLNVLYSAWPIAGTLQQATFETRANQFFDEREIPNMLWEIMLWDTLAETRHKPRILQTSEAELHRVKNQLRGRWVKNLLHGRPEPRFPRFDIEAVAMIWEDGHQRLLTYHSENGPFLPRVQCDGDSAPWEQLAVQIQQKTGLEVPLRWVGLWQDAAQNKLEFVFAMTIEEAELYGDAEWSMSQNSAFNGRDEKFIEMVKSSFQRDRIWTLKEDERHEDSKIILMKK